MPLPTGLKYEWEFTPGVWTDVTADVDANTGHTIHVGRTTPREQPQAGSASVTFFNAKGKFTPGVQVLTDGTAAPYYPNVRVRTRLRISNSSGVRFVGLVKSIMPQTNGFAGSARCVVSAVDRLDALSRVSMDTAIRQEVLADSPVLYWPMTDASGASFAAEQSGSLGPALAILDTAQAPLVFGDNGPGSGDGPGVLFAPTSSSAGQTLSAAIRAVIPTGAVITFEAWVNPGTAAQLATNACVLSFPSGLDRIAITAGHPTYSGISGPAINDGGWHHLALTKSGTAIKFYVDGALVGSDTVLGGSNLTRIDVGVDSLQSGTKYKGNLGQVAIYAATLSAARVLAHFNAGMGWTGETTATRVARFLSYGGVDPADMTLDTSAVTVGTYPQGGKDIFAACQDMAETEGGGSVFYVLGGQARFTNRATRKAAAPLITINAPQDGDRDTYQPGEDDQSLTNSSTASRNTESGTQTSVTAIDQDSIDAYQLATDDVATYTTSDDDALHRAQYEVALGATPGFRLPQITVDLLTAEHNLYAAAQAVQIGSRLRATNLPAGQTPATQLDVLVEGWTETVNTITYKMTFDTSPADNPAFMLLNDAAYGRLACAPDCALNAALTNSATTVVIKTPTAPRFTQVVARYPMTITVDAEQITLNTKPSGGTTPQTFTGVTRGANGTTASAHASGATVQLWPAPALAL